MFKPLEWEKHSNNLSDDYVETFLARTPFSTVYVLEKDRNGRYDTRYMEGNLCLCYGLLAELTTEETAKAAAVVDYRKRLRDAVKPLEWKDGTAIVGEVFYSIEEESGDDVDGEEWVEYVLHVQVGDNYNTREIAVCMSEDDAKRNAQEDYYRRIGL